MTNNRVAFMSAMALAVMSLFLVGGSEASLIQEIAKFQIQQG